MIKFKAVGGGRTSVGLGISAENVKRLGRGEPIHIKLRDLEIETDIEIIIFYGETEAILLQTLKDGGFIGEETKTIMPDDSDIYN